MTLAKAGVQVTVLEAADEIGGGTRSSEAILPGLLHDHSGATAAQQLRLPRLAARINNERVRLGIELP